MNDEEPRYFSSSPSESDTGPSPSPSPAAAFPAPQPPSDASADPGGLQFDRAEMFPAGATQGATACAVCSASLHGSYFDINGKPACEKCRYEVERAWQAGPDKGAFPRALAAGLAGGIAGALVWYLVLITTDYEVGLIGILVGFLVGRGVAWGVRGRGGWRYQGLAMLLTYLAITSTYVPLLLKHADQPTAERLGGTAYLLALLFAIKMPFLLAAEGHVMGLVIIGIALYEAWKLNRRQNLVVGGPYPVAPRPGAASATPPPAGA